MDRSLHGLPPIRRSNGPHSASCNTQRQTSSSVQICKLYLALSLCHKLREMREIRLKTETERLQLEVICCQGLLWDTRR